MGKIQERCCHGLSASSASQRAIVDAEASVRPRSITSRCSSAREKRDNGRPCARGSPQAIAFTSATSSGGKTPRTARSRSIAKTIPPLHEGAFTPQRHRPQRAVEATGNLRVRPPLGGKQHDLRAQHLTVRHRVARSAQTQLPRFLLAQLDPEGTLRHDILFAAQPAVPSTDRARITDREHLSPRGEHEARRGYRPPSRAFRARLRAIVRSAARFCVRGVGRRVVRLSRWRACSLRHDGASAASAADQQTLRRSRQQRALPIVARPASLCFAWRGRTHARHRLLQQPGPLPAGVLTVS